MGRIVNILLYKKLKDFYFSCYRRRTARGGEASNYTRLFPRLSPAGSSQLIIENHKV